MCGLLSPSWPSPLSLNLKGAAATVPLRSIFAVTGALYSFIFSYCPLSLIYNFVAIPTTAAATSSITA